MSISSQVPTHHKISTGPRLLSLTPMWRKLLPSYHSSDRQLDSKSSTPQLILPICRGNNCKSTPLSSITILQSMHAHRCMELLHISTTPTHTQTHIQSHAHISLPSISSGISLSTLPCTSLQTTLHSIQPRSLLLNYTYLVFMLCLKCRHSFAHTASRLHALDHILPDLPVVCSGNFSTFVLMLTRENHNNYK